MCFVLLAEVDALRSCLVSGYMIFDSLGEQIKMVTNK